VGFDLSNNILQFFPICHQLSPSSLNPSSFFLCSNFITISFYCVGLLVPRQTPNLEDQGIPFCLGHHLSGMGGPNTSIRLMVHLVTRFLRYLCEPNVRDNIRHVKTKVYQKYI
jgi:hypothetical protein